MRLYKIKNRAFSVKEMKKYEPLLIASIDEIYDYFRTPIPVTFVLIYGTGAHSEGVISAFVKTQKEQFRICIYSDFIKKFIFKNKNYFTSVIMHEFAHVHDIYSCIYSKKCPYNPESPPKSEDEYYMRLGFDFWTEFFAFSVVYQAYKTKDYPTIKTVITQSAKVRALLDDFETKPCQKKYSLFIGAAKNLVYLFANTLAGYKFAVSRYYKYSEKTKQNPDYTFVVDFMKELNSLIYKMKLHKHNKSFKKNIHKLGKFIFECIYEQMGLEIFEKENKTYSIGYPKSNLEDSDQQK